MSNDTSIEVQEEKKTSQEEISDEYFQELEEQHQQSVDYARFVMLGKADI